MLAISNGQQQLPTKAGREMNMTRYGVHGEGSLGEVDDAFF
jgi:hypothetical protein